MNKEEPRRALNILCYELALKKLLLRFCPLEILSYRDNF